LLIGSYRTADAATSPLLRVLLAEWPRTACEVRTIRVDPLGADDARTLAAHVLDHDGEDHSDDSLAHRIGAVVAEAGGHPLFIAELARAVGQVTVAPDRPLGLDDVLAERIARLPPEAHALLVASSVAGRPLPVSLVGRASRLVDEAAALATLQSALLVRTRAG